MALKEKRQYINHDLKLVEIARLKHIATLQQIPLHTACTEAIREYIDKYTDLLLDNTANT